MSDRILLTIPAENGFEAVAQLVLGGVAARLNLSYESLDDLGIALATLLERRHDGELTVELDVADDSITTLVGPFDESVAQELRSGGEGFDLHRILVTVTDGFDVVERDGASFVELRKTVDRAGAA